jgi:hypothetical protein
VVAANAHTGHGGTDKDGNDKPPPDRLRGSSRFRQAWDFEWRATGFELRCTKNRYGPKFETVPYQIVPCNGSLVVKQGASRGAAEDFEPGWPHPVTCG